MPDERSIRETATGKAKVVHDLLDTVDEIKQAVRDDLLKLIKRMPVDLPLREDGAIEEFLAEAVAAVMRRHVVAADSVDPKVAAAVRAYVRGMRS